MKQIVLLAGVPGSGKTTLAQKLVEKGFVRLCADDIRQELWGDAADQRDPAQVFDVFFQQLDKALEEGADIVVDNTNINQKHRQPIVRKAVEAGYNDIQIWILDTPLEVCLERNRSRMRAVPDEILVNMFNSLTGPGKPRSHEGKIVIVRQGLNQDEFRFFLPRTPQSRPKPSVRQSETQ